MKRTVAQWLLEQDLSIKTGWRPPLASLPHHDSLEEALLEDPNDPEMLAVYADFLHHEGDGRGEALGAFLLATEDPDRHALFGLLDQWTSTHLATLARPYRAVFGGDASAYTFRGGLLHAIDRSLIRDTFPIPELQRPGTETLQWLALRSLGAMHADWVTLPTDRLRTLVLSWSGRPNDARPPPAGRLLQLQLEGETDTGWQLDLGNIQRFDDGLSQTPVLHAPHLTTYGHDGTPTAVQTAPRVPHLVFRGRERGAVLTLPKQHAGLQELTLEYADDAQVDELASVLPDLPALRRVNLGGIPDSRTSTLLQGPCEDRGIQLHTPDLLTQSGNDPFFAPADHAELAAEHARTQRS